MDMLELLSGNRVNYAINTLGGVRRDVDESISSQIRLLLKPLKTLRSNLRTRGAKMRAY